MVKGLMLLSLRVEKGRLWSRGLKELEVKSKREKSKRSEKKSIKEKER